MIRWRTSEDNPCLMNLEMKQGDLWVRVPMFDVDGNLLIEHPRDTITRKKNAAKKLKQLADQSRAEQNCLTGKKKKVK